MTPPPPPPEPAHPPTFLDFAFQAAENAADALIAGVPEVRSVMVLFDWGVPVSADVPPGVAYTRGPGGAPEEVRHPLGLFGLLQQHARMGLILTTRFQQMLRAADETAGQLSQVIHERQRQLDELDQAVAARQAALAGPAPGGGGGAAGPAERGPADPGPPGGP